MWGLNLVDIHDNTETQLSGIDQLWGNFASSFGSFASGIAASVARINALVITGPKRSQSKPTGVSPLRPLFSGSTPGGTVTGSGTRLPGTAAGVTSENFAQGVPPEAQALGFGIPAPPAVGPSPPAINPGPPSFGPSAPQLLPGDPPELISIVNNFNGPVISPSRVMEATEKVIQEHNRNPSRYYDDYDDSGIPIEGY